MSPHISARRISTYGSRQWALFTDDNVQVAVPKRLPDGTTYEALFFRTKREALALINPDLTTTYRREGA